MGFTDFIKFRSEDYKLMQYYYPNSSVFKKLFKNESKSILCGSKKNT